MLVSFTGAGSTGKTTLINKLKECKGAENFVFVDDTTRNVKIAPINNDADDYNQTQIEIAMIHQGNIWYYESLHDRRRDSNPTMILPRCALDGAIYTEYFFRKGKVNAHNRALAWQIWSDVRDKYDVIFYPDPADVPLTNDGVRSMDPEFRNEIIKLYKPFLRSSGAAYNKFVILSGSIEERLEKVKKRLYIN
jgi:nicotinamide riboside kinase